VAHAILQQNLVANKVQNVTLMRGAIGSVGAPPDVETVDELQLERLDWLKLNDGATGLEVLEGATQTLWRLRPSLFAAAPDEPTLRALADRAKEHGYRCWRMTTHLFNPGNFNLREGDLFEGGTALALLAIPEETGVDSAFDGCIELP
jgi:hypothetical protein